MKKILLDTDAGVDDVLALLLLLRCPELAECIGITVVAGNTHLDHCVSNVRRALGIAEQYTDGLTARISSIPVSVGAAAPLSRPLLRAVEVHGPDGLGGTSALTDTSGAPVYPEHPVPIDTRPAHRFILDAANNVPGEVTLVAIGPLTNLALACQEDHQTFRKLKEITLMGGAFHHDGNASARAEFNILVDPEAARIVLDSGVPVTMVPLDCTEQTQLIQSDLDGDGPIHAFVRAATSTIMGFYRRFEGFEGIYHHDPFAMGVALDPSFAFGLRTRVEIETQGKYTTGETVAALRRQRALLDGALNAHVCLHADAERFNAFFLNRVLPVGA